MILHSLSHTELDTHQINCNTTVSTTHHVMVGVIHIKQQQKETRVSVRVHRYGLNEEDPVRYVYFITIFIVNTVN